MPYSSEIANRWISALPRSSDRVFASDLLDFDLIPQVVRGFCRMELEIAVTSDLDDLKSHFQLPAELESALYRALFLGLAQGSTMAVQDAKRILQRASEDAIQYLTQPVAFLLDLLANEEHVELGELFLHSLDHLAAYPHFPDVLRAWAERLLADGISRVPRSDFRLLLGRIDREIVSGYGIDDLQGLLLPLFSLFESHSVPKDLLLLFFREKGAGRVVSALRNDPRSELSLTETLDLLAILMHRATYDDTPDITEASFRTEQSQPASQSGYDDFLRELQTAGVHIGGRGEVDLLREIETRSSSGGGALAGPHA